VALVPAVLLVALRPSRIAAAWRWARRRPAIAATAGAGGLVVLVAIGVVVARATGSAGNVAFVWRDIHSTGELISRVGIEAKTKVLSFGGLDTQSNPWGPVPSAISFLSAAAMVLLLAVGWMARRRIGAKRLDRFPVAWLAVRLWALGYVAVGAVLGVQSIELATSGRQFPDRWEGQRAVSAAYRVAFGEGRPGDRANLMPAVVEELRRYEPLARPGPRS
jgi:hypothetical protein